MKIMRARGGSARVCTAGRRMPGKKGRERPFLSPVLQLWGTDLYPPSFVVVGFKVRMRTDVACKDRGSVQCARRETSNVNISRYCERRQKNEREGTKAPHSSPRRNRRQDQETTSARKTDARVNPRRDSDEGQLAVRQRHARVGAGREGGRHRRHHLQYYYY